MISPNWSRPPPKRKAFSLFFLDELGPWLLVAGLFYGLRRLEVWLHQHIFKVGWLVIKQYQTTTVLYYAFFLPGIILNQLIFWLAAGFLNVGAERSIAWPEKQEIGELKLGFVKLMDPKNIGSMRMALISAAPLLVGLLVVWHVANNVLNLPGILSALNQGTIDLSTAINQFTTAPDFWIWFYLAFTISNTMMPNFEHLRGWRIVLGAVVVVIVIFYLLGAGDQVIMTNLRGPVSSALNAVSSIFAVIIILDLIMVGILGTIEALVERITGDSATFENGTMVTMRRSEVLARRAQALAVRPQRKSGRAKSPSGPPSIYRLPLPIPAAPGKEAITAGDGIVITPEVTPSLASGTPAPERVVPKVIPGATAEKLPPPSPFSSPSAKPASVVTAPASLAARAISPPTKPAEAIERHNEATDDEEVEDDAEE